VSPGRPRIDPGSRSRDNPFSSVRLDRLVDRRDDAEWLAHTGQSSAAHYVPIWRGRNLISRAGDEQVAEYLRHEDLRLLAPLAQTAPATLLGTDRKRIYFALTIDDDERERVLEQRRQAAFVDLRLASLDMDAKHAGVLAYAKALLYWQYRHAFCGLCGSVNTLGSAGHKMVCSNPDCARESFPRIDPAIIVLVTHDDACLLGRNHSWPEKRFSALAGFVEPGESLEDAVAREVHEEVEVELESLRYVSSQPWPFPASAMCGFYAAAGCRDFQPSAEIDEARWVTAKELRQAVADDDIRLPPPVSIAFRLIADWYRAQCGESLEELVKPVW
jgi:NAD+ diphosphatase